MEFRDVVAADAAREFQEKLAAGEFPGSVRDVFYIVLKQPQLGTVILPVSDFTIASRGLKRRVRMRPAAELAGRVTDKDGKPVAGATVAAGALGGVLCAGGSECREDGCRRAIIDSRISWRLIVRQASADPRSR